MSMKNFAPANGEVFEALASGHTSGATFDEVKKRLTEQYVVAEIRDIYSGNIFATHDRIKRLCTVLDFMIRTGAIKF